MRLLSGFLALALLAGCNQPNPRLLKTEPLTPAETSIEARLGQSLEIVLPALGDRPNYKWVLESGYDTALLRLTAERAAQTEFPTNPPPGYAPNRVFSFTALAVGKTVLSFTQQPLASVIAPVDIHRRFPVDVRASLSP